MDAMPPRFNLFSATSRFDWPIAQKEVKQRKLPKIEGFILSSSPLAHLHVWGAMENMLGEYIENFDNRLKI
jgi:hypothetical protein